jgi:hypothetical protein
MTDVSTPSQSAPVSQRCPLRTLMAFDFEQLMDEFDDFVAALEVDDRKHALALWHTFETRLCRRLSLEEELLLPAFALARTAEAEVLEHEQESLRGSLRRVRASLELNLLRAEHVQTFFRALRAHRHHKDGLYSWAEQQLSPEVRDQILQRLQQPAQDAYC